MIKVHIGAFETNSSSTHSLILCSDAESKALHKGEAMIDTWDDNVVPFDDVEKKRNKYRYQTLDEFWDTELETYEETRTIDGVIIHAIGKYGFDG